MSINKDLLVVWITGSVPNDKEKSIIENIAGATSLMNASFFRARQSDKINGCKVLNLTDRKDIDEFYKDELVGIDDVVTAKAKEAKGTTKTTRGRKGKPKPSEDMPEGVVISKPMAERE